MFRDRIEAGNQLAEKLLHYKNKEVVVLAIPRGGLPLGAIVARALDAPLNVALSKKIGYPGNKEFAIGAVSMEDVVLDKTLQVPENYLESETALIRKSLAKKYEQYYKNFEPEKLAGKIVILIDDGIATGNTLFVTISLVAHQDPAGIVVAIPVAPPSVIERLNNFPEVDEVICLETPFGFRAVGQFYEDFSAISDEEAINLLEKSNR
ncbi:phosphoribosyltransferase [Gillisia sp. Q332]|uniref:phosphoribosyltransferase n=1 Tax=Gillisia xinjiangensis TaxID=3384765 RepID=UPI00391BC463